MTPDPKQRDWMEPPEWWKRWRPLRWLAAGLIALGAYSWLQPLLPTEPAAVPTATAPVVAVPPVETAPAAVASAAPQAPVEPVAAPPPAAAAPKPAVVFEEEEALPPVAYQAYLASPSDPVPLIAGIKSYSSVDDVFARLKQGEREPQQQSFHTRVREGVPPRELDVLSMKPYQHLGVEGALELQFFNDRLYQAEFEPADAEAYRKALRQALPDLKRRRSGRSELHQGHLRVASSLDLSVSDVGQALRTRPFVIWQDTRLVQQRDAWDREFGPKKAAP